MFFCERYIKQFKYYWFNKTPTRLLCITYNGDCTIGIRCMDLNGRVYIDRLEMKFFNINLSIPQNSKGNISIVTNNNIPYIYPYTERDIGISITVYNNNVSFSSTVLQNENLLL